ncbi:DNA polymerase III subunit beta [Dethiosulfatarculus sandiegensis]|uniref:Beta sliding clamp n=1 Tax=Dethiosulfatarculus sandiegensis TaxID=1429043 RepID=A0A0D2JY99_9BACT|nr:DNA polymerase III subunit beta [Dethiosulfatarculus sandiegensis]KIX14505.1 DNA polymerase III subunit beta [Dethiosulfatarculus sandiegensis]
MEFSVRKEDLVKGLARSQAVVEKRTAMPILSNVLLDAREDKIIMRASDLETSFEGSYPARVQTQGSTTVPARKLFEIVKELPAEEIYLKEKENSYLHISGARANFELVGIAADEFPAFPEVTDAFELTVEAKILQEAIEKTMFAISQEDTRFNLAGLYVEKFQMPDGPALRCVATDGHRLSLIDKQVDGMEEFGLSKGVIIPRKGVSEIRKLCEEGGDIVLGLSKESAYVSKNEVKLILRMQEGAFPDYEVVIPKNTQNKAFVNRQAFSDVLKRVALLATDRFQGVALEFKEGLLEVQSQNPELGKASESLEMDYDGATLKVGFNAKYFLDICNAMKSEEISLAFIDEQNPCLVSGEGDPGYLSVVMPMRL